jgi:hypothetical protein
MSSGKRKEPPPLPTHPKGRFKAVSHLMVALQRFKGVIYFDQVPVHELQSNMTGLEAFGQGFYDRG